MFVQSGNQSDRLGTAAELLAQLLDLDPRRPRQVAQPGHEVRRPRLHRQAARPRLRLRVSSIFSVIPVLPALKPDGIVRCRRHTRCRHLAPNTITNQENLSAT